MEKVAWGAMIGCVGGAITGYIGSMMQRQKEESSNLGYAWENIRQDAELTSALYEIKAVVDASTEAQQHYFDCGQACDNLVSLYKIISASDTRPQRAWSFKAWTYRRGVENALSALGTHYQEAISQKKRVRNLSSDEKTMSLADYFDCADALCKIVRNYYFNINHALHDKYMKGHEDFDCAGNHVEHDQTNTMGMSPFAQQTAFYQQRHTPAIKVSQ